MNLKVKIDFKHPLIPDNGLAFNRFEKVIAAAALDEVIPALRQVEQAAKDGFYAVGFISYEAAPAFDPALTAFENAGRLPLLCFGLARDPDDSDSAEQGEFAFGQWRPDWGQERYMTAFETVQDEIRMGNTYQVNLTFPLRTEFHGDIPACYNHLRQAQASNYCGFMQSDDFSIVSASPELFFSIQNKTITTRPMKGTRPRGMTLEEDIRLRKELASSEKDRAENLMIVDLLRNDAGRIAVGGTVREPELFTVEKYPTVWQMTSVIEAELPTETSLIDIFKGLFPCGSVTGAPKVSTMKIINRLETAPRSVYCGAFGIVLPGGDCVFNVPIRTATILPDEAVYHVGSGLVADSQSEDEYRECLHKADVLSRDITEFELLETMSWFPDKGFYLWREHLDRVTASAEYFDFNISNFRTKLEQDAKLWFEPMRVRALCSRNGIIDITAVTLPKQNPLRRVKLASAPVNSNNPFLYHKTTNRKIYDQHRADMGEVDDVILYNERGEITEATIANIAVCLDGTWCTPPVSSGLLAGTMRRHLLETGELQAQVLTVNDLKKAPGIKLMNSVRGLFKVELID